MMQPHLDVNTTSSTQDISTVSTNGDDTSSTQDSLSTSAVSDTNIVEVKDSVASVADITTAARNTDSSDDTEVAADVEAGVDSKSYTDESVDESIAVGSVDGDDNSDAGKLNSNAVISNNSDPIVRKSQVPNLEERSKVHAHTFALL